MGKDPLYKYKPFGTEEVPPEGIPDPDEDLRTRRGKEYKFIVSYLDEGVIRTHVEIKPFLNSGSAYLYFEDLCETYSVGPYYYLCSWNVV